MCDQSTSFWLICDTAFTIGGSQLSAEIHDLGVRSGVGIHSMNYVSTGAKRIFFAMRADTLSASQRPQIFSAAAEHGRMRAVLRHSPTNLRRTRQSR